MKRLLVPLFALVLLVTPAVLPTVQVTSIDQNNATIMTAGNVNMATAPTTNTATFNLPFTGRTVSVSPGGEAQAWNLIYELCRAGVPGMCELYQDGQGILW